MPYTTPEKKPDAPMPMPTPNDKTLEHVDSEADEISKSERKRQMHRLQELGEQLTQLKPAQWEPLKLPASLIEALTTAPKIKKHEARRRHQQFIGKLMRKLDESTIAHIDQLLESIRNAHQQTTDKFKHIEHWRDQLAAGDAQVIEQLLQEYPQADRQWLRQIQRSCKQEAAGNKPPQAARKLFKYLRELMGA